MSPARAAPGWSPPRAVLAGRVCSSSRARSRRAPRRAPGACRGRAVGRLRAERAVGGRTTPTRSASRSRGSLRGSPTPPISARGAPARELPARGRPATSPRPPRPRRGRKGAHVQVSVVINAALPLSAGPFYRPTARRGAARQGRIPALRHANAARHHIARKQAAPAARLAVTAREAPAGGERRKRTRRPRARS